MEKITFTLRPLPPFRLDFTVWALRRRPDNIADLWDGKCYTRILPVYNKPVKITVHQKGTSDHPALHAAVSGKWAVPYPELRSIVKKFVEKVLGLRRDLQRFYELAREDEALMQLADHFKGVKPPQFPTIFEALINALACQQISLHVGIILLNRLVTAYGLSFKEGKAEFFAFPRPQDLYRAEPEDLRRLGFSLHKSDAIIELSRRIVDGELDLSKVALMGSERASEYLEEIKGIGRWSSEYVMLRGLGRINLFPGDDIGAQKNLQELLGLRKRLDYEKIRFITGRWQPYAGMVYFHLLLHNLEKQGCL